jgi:hypothetical protein
VDKLLIELDYTYGQGRIGSPNFGAIFFQEAPKKRSINKNYKGQMPMSKQKCKKKKTLIGEGPPNWRAPVGYFPPRYMASSPLLMDKCSKMVFTLTAYFHL